jgi:hypothetical protein
MEKEQGWLKLIFSSFCAMYISKYLQQDHTFFRTTDNKLKVIFF